MRRRDDAAANTGPGVQGVVAEAAEEAGAHVALEPVVASVAGQPVRAVHAGNAFGGSVDHAVRVFVVGNDAVRVRAGYEDFG